MSYETDTSTTPGEEIDFLDVDDVANKALKNFRTALKQREEIGQKVIHPIENISQIGADEMHFDFPVDDAGIRKRITVEPIKGESQYAVKAIARMPNGGYNLYGMDTVAGHIDVATTSEKFQSTLLSAYDTLLSWGVSDLHPLKKK